MNRVPSQPGHRLCAAVMPASAVPIYGQGVWEWPPCGAAFEASSASMCQGGRPHASVKPGSSYGLGAPVVNYSESRSWTLIERQGSYTKAVWGATVRH
jgi:hypothetical protein